jgi:hypothetical protein
MRSYGMYDVTRGLTLALFAGLAGVALWGATEVGMQSDGRFWLALAIVAVAGLLLTLATHVGTWTKGLRMRVSPTTFALAFLPVLICVGWILLASQPGHGWEEGRIDGWSNSIGILGLVHSAGLWRGVLAFGFGVMLGLSLDGVPEPMVAEAPAYEPAPARAAGPRTVDEPVTAERRWAARRGEGTASRGGTRSGTATQVRERRQDD